MIMDPNQFNNVANQIGFGGGRGIENAVKAAEPVVKSVGEKIVEEGPKLIENIIKAFFR